MVSKLVERTFGFPDNDDEREGPWAGMNVLRNGEESFFYETMSNNNDSSRRAALN